MFKKISNFRDLQLMLIDTNVKNFYQYYQKNENSHLCNAKLRNYKLILRLDKLIL